MKLCVTSTSMMNPVLLRSAPLQGLDTPPTRVLGLLALDAISLLNPDDSNATSRSTGLSGYHRPTTQSQHQRTLAVDRFLQLSHQTDQPHYAVFGFLFDGQSCWYRIWDEEASCTYWLKHDNNMAYTPYDIVAMDLLLSMKTNWNGDLYLQPEERCEPHDYDQSAHWLDARAIHSVLVSDAAVMRSGKLWFLITVKPIMEAVSDAATRTHTGWVSFAA